MVIVLCLPVRGCDINCDRAKRSFDLLAEENDRDAVHVHLWNDMDQEENIFPNLLGQGTTPMPQEEVDSVTIPVTQQPTDLPQEMYRKSDRDLYSQLYNLNMRKNKNIRPSNPHHHPSRNYGPNGYKSNYRAQPVPKLPPIVRQSLYGMYMNQNQPNYYTNLHRKKKPRLPTPIESDLIRIASGKIIANEPKPHKYHKFQLHEAMPGQKLLPPTRIPLFKPVPPPVRIVPIIDDDFTVLHLPSRLFRPHGPPSPMFHPTTFQPNNTHPYPFHTTDFNLNSMYLFNAQDAMTPPSVQKTAPVTDVYTITTSTTTMNPITSAYPPTTGTTTAATPTSPSTLHVTYSRPTYPNVVYAVPATTESSNATQASAKNSSQNAQEEFRIMTINNIQQPSGFIKGNADATNRPTLGRRRPYRQKQRRRPYHRANLITQIKRPLPLITLTTTSTTEPPKNGQQSNQRNESFQFGQKSLTQTAEQSKKQESVVYGRPKEALIVDPPSYQNGTIEVNTPYSKPISNRSDQLERHNHRPTHAEDDELINLNRDIKRVLEVTSTPPTPTTITDKDASASDDDDIDGDPLLMENLNKNGMLPIVADNIFERDDLLSETHTQKRAFTDANNNEIGANRRSDNVVDNVTAMDVDRANAIDAENTRPLDEDKYYKWYSRYAADNKRKYGRAIISEHFKKVEIEPNVAWVILPR